jgi:hypothetical protein
VIHRDRPATVAVIVGIVALIALLISTRPHSRSEKTFVSVPQRGDPVSAERRVVALGPLSLPSISAADKEKRCRDSWFSSRDNDLVSLSELARQLSLSQAPTDRSLGLYWQAHVASFEAFRAYEAKNPKCFEKNNRECPAEANRIGAQAARVYREPLAKFASTSDNSEVYAIGFYACDSYFAPGTDSQCTQLSAEQWARLEPNNAVPWLYVAREAAKRGTLATRDEALFRASRAQTSDSHWSTFVAHMLQSSAQGSQPLEIQTAADRTGLGWFGTSDAPAPSVYPQVYNFCSADAVADPNRRQVCSDLAEVMTERADRPVTLFVGSKVANNVGWPPDRLRILQDRMAAYTKIDQTSLWSPENAGSCDFLRSVHSWVSDALRYGQVGAYQRAIAASGKTAAQLAQMQHSEEERRRAEQAQANASAKASLPEHSKSGSQR